MLVVDWQLTLIAVAITPILVVARLPLLEGRTRCSADDTAGGRRDDRRRGEHRRRPRRQVVRAGAEGEEKFAGRSERVFAKQHGREAPARDLRPVLSFLPGSSRSRVILVGGQMVVHGYLTSPTSSPSTLVLMLVMPLRMLGMWIGQSQRGPPPASASRGARRGRRHQGPTRRGRPCLPVRGRVRFEDVTFEYADGRPVLEGIDLELEPGKTVALIGHTGSGKTTLATLVPRFYDVTAGRLTVDGLDVAT